MSEPLLDARDRALIDRLQDGLPLVERPYAAAAGELGLSEADLLARLRRLLDAGVLSRFGPMYHAERLGGGLSLAAMAVPEPDFEAVAETVNGFPEVAHNYARDHDLNMWFVLATERPGRIPETIREIEAATGLSVYDMPKRREFYVGLRLRARAEGDAGASEGAAAGPVPRARGSDDAEGTPGAAETSAAALDPLDRALVEHTQAGLPLQPDPWGAVAAQAGTDRAAVLARLARMQETGAIRRIGAVPNHYALGYRANGMSVWDVPDDRVAELGRRVGDLAFVSHAYERPRHPPIWPYNLFAMVHGKTRDEVQAQVAQIAALLGPADRGHAVLYSTRILKKTGLRLSAAPGRSRCSA